MKSLIILILSVFIFMGSLVWADDCRKSAFGEYSYQGHIDPQRITNEWEFLADYTKEIGPSAAEIYWKNPVESNLTVAVFLVFQGAFLGYAYLLDDVVYLYLLNMDNKCYIGKVLEGDAKFSFRKKLLIAGGAKSL